LGQMKSKRKTVAAPTRSPERTKGQLIQAARTLFARQGLHGTTVQEISKEAGVNVSLISHYYKGKEGLYRACIEDFGEARLKVLDRVLEIPRSKDEFRIRLELFVNELLDFHLENHETTTILLRDLMFETHLWGQKSENMLFSFITRLAEYFEQAKKKKYLSQKTDAVTAAGIVYLTFLALFQVNHITEKRMGISIKDRDLRTQIVKQTLDTLWFGIHPD